VNNGGAIHDRPPSSILYSPDCGDLSTDENPANSLSIEGPRGVTSTTAQAGDPRTASLMRRHLFSGRRRYGLFQAIVTLTKEAVRHPMARSLHGHFQIEERRLPRAAGACPGRSARTSCLRVRAATPQHGKALVTDIASISTLGLNALSRISADKAVSLPSPSFSREVRTARGRREIREAPY